MVDIEAGFSDLPVGFGPVWSKDRRNSLVSWNECTVHVQVQLDIIIYISHAEEQDQIWVKRVRHLLVEFVNWDVFVPAKNNYCEI